MFSLDIVDTDKFLEMPSSTQALYFHLGTRADDDGFVSSPRKIVSIANCGIDDLKLLITKNFIIPFDSGVCVIKDWKRNNYIQKDRYRETIYIQEKENLLTLTSGEYQLKTAIFQSLSTECIQDVSNLDTQVRLGKVRDSKEKNSCSNSLKANSEHESIFEKF